LDPEIAWPIPNDLWPGKQVTQELPFHRCALPGRPLPEQWHHLSIPLGEFRRAHTVYDRHQFGPPATYRRQRGRTAAGQNGRDEE
jgi:hypothetical protein